MAAAKALDLVPDRRKQDLCRRAYQELHYSTHCASIASASVSFTTRTGSFFIFHSFAALRRPAPATTSYLLSSSSRTRRGARIPCVLKLAANSSRLFASNRFRGLVDWWRKSYGERLRGCNPRNMNPAKVQELSPELQAALGPLLGAIESLSERIVEYNERIEQIAKQSYPEVGRLKQVKGVGTLIALTYVLTLEDAHRFGKEPGCGLLCRAATRTEELGAERAATAH